MLFRRRQDHLLQIASAISLRTFRAVWVINRGGNTWTIVFTARRGDPFPVMVIGRQVVRIHRHVS